jgi:hypothetical protein
MKPSRLLVSMMLALSSSIVLAAPIGSTGDLSYNQRQAVDRQERNLKEAQKKLDSCLGDFAKETGELGDALIPPAYFEQYIAKADEVITKCEAMLADLDKNSCPTDDARVKAIREFADSARTKVTEFKSGMEPKLSEMRKLSDPANYPNLDADFEKLDEFANAYATTSFLSHPEKIAQLASEFPQVTKWCSERYAEYKPLLVLTGGKSSPLFKRYEKTANSVKKFQAAAGDFVKECEQDVPGLCKDAVAMGEQAAADKKPAFFTGGVKQKLEQANARITVCASLLQPDDSRMKAMNDAMSGAKSECDRLASTLKAEILAATRAPNDLYAGSDKVAHEKAIRAAWQAKWSGDEILGLRFHMEQFDRNTKWTWYDSDSSWNKSDMSVLCVTVVVKTSDEIATMYPAYVNVDHLSDKTTYGVDTKGSAYVVEEMLVANWK